MMPIKLDPNWKGGDYFGGPEPAEGAHSLKTITLTALHFGWAEKVHGYKWAAEGRNPQDAMANLFATKIRSTRRAWRAPPPPTPPIWCGWRRRTSYTDRHDLSARAAELYEIEGSSGHLDGIFSIGKVADRIKAFLEK